MTKPSDAEIAACIAAAKIKCVHPDAETTIGIARAVLAKWGTPPAGKPIGYLYCGGSYGDELSDWEIVADQYQCERLNEHYGSLGKEATLPIYTTPQPTQPALGWVPLPKSYQGSTLTSNSHDAGCRVSFSFSSVAEAEAWHESIVDQRHGIKGGQHGTE